MSEYTAAMEEFANIPTIFPDSEAIQDSDVPDPETLTDHDLWIAATADHISVGLRESLIWALMGRAHQRGDKWMRYPMGTDYQGKIFYP